MLSDTLTIRPFLGTGVFCESDGCASPAVYLFFAERQRDRRWSIEFGARPRGGTFLMCSAFCHAHAVRFMPRYSLCILPPITSCRGTNTVCPGATSLANETHCRKTVGTLTRAYMDVDRR
jgi:hypothetical protein